MSRDVKPLWMLLLTDLESIMNPACSIFCLIGSAHVYVAWAGPVSGPVSGPDNPVLNQMNELIHSAAEEGG